LDFLLSVAVPLNLYVVEKDNHKQLQLKSIG